MKYKVIIGLVILVLAIGAIMAFAGANKNNNTENKENIDQSQQSAPQESVTQMPSVTSSQQNPTVNPTVVISPAGQTFEIRGAITSVSGSTFVVDGKTITINPAMVVNFQQTADVTVGNQVKVEGIVSNGTLFAREIKPLSEDNSGKN